MSATAAFAQYEAIRHRLPQEPVGDHAPLVIESLLEVAERFDVFLFDAFGVLNVGEVAIPGAIERVRALQAMGKQCLVVSNGAGMAKPQVVQKMRERGFDFDAEHIVNSRDALIEGLKTYPANMLWGRIGPEKYQEDLAELGIASVDQNHPDFARADGYLFFSPQRWPEACHQQFLDDLAAHPRPVLLGNPDLIAPLADSISIEAGSYILPLHDTLFQQVKVFGKPFASIFDIAAKRLHHLGHDLDHHRTLMIGDTLHTDILGGNAYGLATCLVTGHGFLRGLDPAEYIAQSGITPDYQLTSI
ncbi:MAG: HAD-IIA family hydrolase [Cardiobacteriaceae bacterium]|nr:HAD-IIA family hydrolase [Cardiobacteriaceae bacterium]